MNNIPTTPAFRDPVRVAIVVSHPIQHFVPFYRSLAASSKLDLTVVFASKIGTKPYFDKDMNTNIAWKMDLLGGYDYVFLPEADDITSITPLKVNNPSIGAELERIKPDVVLIYGYSSVTSLRTLWWCRTRKIPTLMISDSELKRPRSRKVNAIKKMTVPILLGQFDGFLTVGDCNEEYYRHYGVSDNKLFRSPFTIDEAIYREIRTNLHKIRDETRETLKLGKNEIVALTVGKINDRKRSRDVLDAARILNRNNSLNVNFRFLMAGNGEIMDELKKEAESENLPVMFLGFVNVDKLPNVYASADFILHPSSRDPHPLVMSEAACIGLPLVVSDRVGAVGPTDIARPDENALVFPVGDAEAIANAVRQLSEDRELRARMGEASLKIFDQQDMKRSVDGAIAAIDYCLRDTRKPLNVVS